MTFDIAGAKASAVDPEAVIRTAAGWASARGADVCLLDARSVFGRDHLESAALHAIDLLQDARNAKKLKAAIEQISEINQQLLRDDSKGEEGKRGK